MKRNDIEALRVVACIGIVWYHAQAPLSDLAYAGLVVFTGLSVQLHSAKKRTIPSLLASKAKRLILPWAFWFILYAGLNLLVGRRFVPAYSDYEILNVLAGSSIHLWFLPFIFTSIISVELFSRVSNPQATLPLAVATYFATFLTVAIWRPTSIDIGYPISQYAQAFASILAGRIIANTKNSSARSKMITAACLLLPPTFALSEPGIGIPYTVGVACLLAVGFFENEQLFKRLPSQLPNATFGVYFLHIAFVAILNRFEYMDAYVNAIISLVASFLCVLAGKKLMPSLVKHIW